MKENKKTIIFSVLGLVVLIVVMIGVTYATFTFTKKGEKINVITTGKLTMTYTESETNIINIPNASPTPDAEGKELTGSDNMFTFEVGASDVSIGEDEAIYYEITAEKITEGAYNSTLDNQYVRLYLEQSKTGTNATDYAEVLPPTSYTPLEAADSLGASAGEMVLYFDRFDNKDKGSKFYKLRMWVSEDYSYGSESKTFAVRVNVYASDTPVTKASGLKLSKDSSNLVVGQTDILTAEVRSGKNRKLIWASSDTSVATVSETGVVTAVKAGTANITVTALDEEGTAGSTTQTCVVTVSNPAAKGITISETLVNLTLSDPAPTQQLTAVVMPTNYANSGSVTWESSDPSVATVSSTGLVTAVKAGTTTITAKILGYTSNKCVVTVLNPQPNSVTIAPATASIEKGQSVKLSASVTPNYATSTDVTWSVDPSSTAYATVNQNGYVTGTGIGTATIWATSAVDSNVKASATITITKMTATNVSLSSGTGDEGLSTGATHTFVGTFKDKNGNEINSDEAWDIIWSDSLSSGIVSGLEDCRGKTSCAVTGEKAGTAAITATAYDSSNQPSATAAATSNLVFKDYKLSAYIADIAKKVGDGEITSEANVTSSTTLFQDATVDKNIRYTGADANVNNYVNFNCDSDGKNCELWRIVGVFNNIKSSENGSPTTRVKLIRATSIGGYSWDAGSENNGWGTNKWEEGDLMYLLNDVDKDGNTTEIWTGQRSELTNNGLYWYNQDGTCFNGQYNSSTSTFPTTPCNFKTNNTGLKTDTTKNMISTAYWNLGGHNNYSTILSTTAGSGTFLNTTLYSTNERGTTKGGSGGALGWTGKVALIYPSDYVYGGYNCTKDYMLYQGNEQDVRKCNEYNWMRKGTSGSHEWLLSPWSSTANSAWGVYWTGHVVHYYTGRGYAVRPAVYLKSDVIVRVDGQDGSSSKPYNIQSAS